MPIKPDFNFDDILKNQDAFIQMVEQTLFDILDRTLIEITNLAKSTNTYTDRTNNLRSSIGYVIYRDGVFVKSNFATDGSGTEGSGESGTSTGLREANEVAKDFSDGYVCVLVAGMDYAVYVESKGYDVVSGSWLQFDNVFQQNAQIIKDAVGIDFKRVK